MMALRYAFDSRLSTPFCALRKTSAQQMNFTDYDVNFWSKRQSRACRNRRAMSEKACGNPKTAGFPFHAQNLRSFRTAASRGAQAKQNSRSENRCGCLRSKGKIIPAPSCARRSARRRRLRRCRASFPCWQYPRGFPASDSSGEPSRSVRTRICNPCLRAPLPRR